MSDTPIDQIVEEAKKPGKFSIVDVVRDRALPKDTVNVYLDEQTAYSAASLKLELKSTDAKDSKYAEIQNALDELTSKLDESKYVFTLTGITEGRREEIYAKVKESFPIEYEDIVNPLTGEKKRNELENPERDRLFTSLLWKEHIEKIVAPDGSEQVDLSIAEINALRSGLPLAAMGMINQTIEKLRAATAMFMISVDEDFLAKP